MAFGAQCSKCGFTNQPGFQFCTNCGSTLGASPPMPAAPPAFGAPPAYGTPPMYGPPTAPVPYAYGPPPWEMERRKKIDRTKTGILLLLIGTLLAWIPVILNLIGGLLQLIGAILVISGRKAFGPAHSRNVVVSIVLFIVAIVVTLVAAFAAWLGPIGTAFSGASQSVIATAFAGAILGTLITTVVATAIFGIAAVLFTFSLQERNGRLLLWAGFGAGVGLQIALLLVVAPYIPTIADGAAAIIASSGNNPFAVTEAVNFAVAEISLRTAGLGLLAVISALLFGAADYLAWSRINRSEIPPPPAPISPLYAQPPGGTMPSGGPAPPINPQ